MYCFYNTQYRPLLPFSWPLHVFSRPLQQSENQYWHSKPLQNSYGLNKVFRSLYYSPRMTSTCAVRMYISQLLHILTSSTKHASIDTLTPSIVTLVISMISLIVQPSFYWHFHGHYYKLAAFSGLYKLSHNPYKYSHTPLTINALSLPYYY